jgi:hypothetical protein
VRACAWSRIGNNGTGGAVCAVCFANIDSGADNSSMRQYNTFRRRVRIFRDARGLFHGSQIVSSCELELVKKHDLPHYFTIEMHYSSVIN